MFKKCTTRDFRVDIKKIFKNPWLRWLCKSLEKFALQSKKISLENVLKIPPQKLVVDLEN